MSSRAKGMLSSIGDENGGDGRSQKDIACANGEIQGPTVDEDEVKCEDGYLQMDNEGWFLY